MSDCIFCKIVKGELPFYKVWEDDEFLAFLSIFPIKKGHTLVIPKEHTDYIFDIEDEKLKRYMIACKKVSEKLKKTFEPTTGKIGVIVYGMDVPHAHVHLSPIDKEGDLSFSNQKKATEEELKTTLDKINNF